MAEGRSGRTGTDGDGDGDEDGDGPLFKDPRNQGSGQVPKVQGGGIGGFFSFSPASRSHEDGEKRGSIATPKATGSETCQCQDGPSRAYRRVLHWNLGGVWPENPTLTGDNRRQSRVGSTNIGIGNCAWGKRQLVNISGHGDRGMAIGACPLSRFALAVGPFSSAGLAWTRCSLCKARLSALCLLP